MHKALRSTIFPPFPEGSEMIQFGMGCFWGAEKMFWQIPGVITTHVGYSGGESTSPSYREVCSGRSGHAEVVRVVYDPTRTRLQELLKTFWEGHDPTQGDGQGNDRGSQYRSCIYAYSQSQLEKAEQSKNLFQSALRQRGYGNITTDIRKAPEFYYAEEDHQQYLHSNPGGYCGHGHTGAELDISAL